MHKNWQPSFLETLKHEGMKFVNHPADPGGATMLGITLHTYRRWVPGATVSDLKRLKPGDDIVQKIYHDGYWEPTRCNELPPGIDYCVYDCAVNSGPNRSVKLLQLSIGADQDGVLGPITMDLAWKLPTEEVIKAYARNRMAFWRRLHHWNTFGRGWTRRGNSVRAFALLLARQAGPHPKQPTPVEQVVSNPIWQWLIPAIIAAIAALWRMLT